MPLRYNKILTLFAILLFSFELLAPSVLIAKAKRIEPDGTSTLGQSNQSFDFLSHLIFEEVGSEEREGKNDCLMGPCFTEVFNNLQKFQPVHIPWSLTKKRFDTHPPLFALHGVLLI